MLKPGMTSLHQIQINQLTKAWIEKRLAQRIEEEKSYSTLNSDLTHLRSLFKWAVDNHYVEFNPFIDIPKFKIHRKTPRILSLDEWMKIWKILKYGRWRALLLSYLILGGRVSELLRPKLKWTDINFETNVITLHRKGNSVQTLPLPELLRNELLWLKEHPYEKRCGVSEENKIFPFPFHKDYISKVIKNEVFKPAGITNASAHDLRRTFGSILVALGWPITVVSKLMNHTTTGITEKIYIGQLDHVQRKALTELSDFLVPQDQDIFSMELIDEIKIGNGDKKNSYEKELVSPPIRAQKKVVP